MESTGRKKTAKHRKRNKMNKKPFFIALKKSFGEKNENIFFMHDMPKKTRQQKNRTVPKYSGRKIPMRIRANAIAASINTAVFCAALSSTK